MKNYFSILAIKFVCIVWFPILFVVHIIRHLFYGVSKFRRRSGNGPDYYFRDRKEFVILAMRYKYGWIIWFIWVLCFNAETGGQTLFGIDQLIDEGGNIFKFIYLFCVIVSFLPLEYIFYPPGNFTSIEIYEYEMAKENKNK